MFKRILAAVAAMTMTVTPVVVTAQSNDGHNRYMRVENRSGLGHSIIRVLMQNPQGQVFEVLPAGYTITAGYNRILNFDDNRRNCVYHIGAVFSNGTYAYRENINVCRYSVWAIYDINNTLN